MDKRTFIRELKQLISVTDEQYRAYYQPLIETKIAEQKYARCLYALKKRRSKMLPIGSDAETCYQQQDVWTYAVFVVASLSGKQPLNALDDAQRALLQQYEAVWQTIEQYLKRDKTTIFSELLPPAEQQPKRDTILLEELSEQDLLTL